MPIEEIVSSIVAGIAEILPRIGGFAIALLIGWMVGRLAGRVADRFARSMKIDERFKESAVSRVLAQFNLTLSDLVGMSIRWFIYLSSLLIALDILGIPALERFSEVAIEYLPSLFGGLLILIGGTVIIEFVAKVVEESLAHIRVPYYRVIMLFGRFILYSTVLVMSLFVMKIDATILYAMLNAIFWGVALGIGAAIGIAFGFGLKDYAASSIKEWLESLGRMEEREKDREMRERIRRYERRIKKLEEELSAERDRVRELESRARAKIQEYEVAVRDIEKKIRELVKDSGEITHAKGGFRIVIRDISTFPLSEVIVSLTNNGFRVTLERGEGEAYIITARVSKSL